MPAFFWSTVGAEVEIPVTNRITACIDVLYKYSRLSNRDNAYNVRYESSLDRGFAAELIGRYYITGPMPNGFYAQAGLGYSSLLYYDGSPRPYSLIVNNWRDDGEGDALREVRGLPGFKPYNFSIGTGYQILLEQRNIVANITVSTQANIDDDGKFVPAFYILPSIGIRF